MKKYIFTTLFILIFAFTYAIDYSFKGGVTSNYLYLTKPYEINAFVIGCNLSGSIILRDNYFLSLEYNAGLEYAKNWEGNIQSLGLNTGYILDKVWQFNIGVEYTYWTILNSITLVNIDAIQGPIPSFGFEYFMPCETQTISIGLKYSYGFSENMPKILQICANLSGGRKKSETDQKQSNINISNNSSSYVNDGYSSSVSSLESFKKSNPKEYKILKSLLEKYLDQNYYNYNIDDITLGMQQLYNSVNEIIMFSATIQISDGVNMQQYNSIFRVIQTTKTVWGIEEMSRVLTYQGPAVK